MAPLASLPALAALVLALAAPASGPARIVSLAPWTTEVLFAIGAGPRVVGATSLCTRPPAAARVPRVGGYEASAEQVLARRPELVVASDGVSRECVDRLRALGGRGPRLCIVRMRTISELTAAIETIGSAAGAQDEARALSLAMRRRIACVQSRSRAKSPRVRVACLEEVDPIWAAGSKTLFDDAVQAAGGVNALADRGDGHVPIALEVLIAARIDLLVILRDRPFPVVGRPGWSAIKAVRSGGVLVIPFDRMRASPDFPEFVEWLERRIAAAGARPRKVN